MQVEIPFFCVFISYTIVSENYFHTRGVTKDFFKEKKTLKFDSDLLHTKKILIDIKGCKISC